MHPFWYLVAVDFTINKTKCDCLISENILSTKFVRETKFRLLFIFLLLLPPPMLIRLVDFLSLYDPLRRLTSNYMLVIFLLLSRRKFSTPKRKENHTIFRDTILLYGISYTPWTLKGIHEIIKKFLSKGEVSSL